MLSRRIFLKSTNRLSGGTQQGRKSGKVIQSFSELSAFSFGLGIA